MYNECIGTWFELLKDCRLLKTEDLLAFLNVE